MGERMTFGRRRSGILLHPTSLPARHGIGDLGPAAYRFFDFLAASGQGWWQVLPVGPTGLGNSPYFSSSAFAGSPLLVSLDLLARDGLLADEELEPPRGLAARRVRYGAARRLKETKLRLAFARWEKRRSSEREEAMRFEEFRAGAASWLPDFALFAALHRAGGGQPWTRWEPEVRRREGTALARARGELGADVRFEEFVQYQFHRQWSDLRRYASSLGIGLIGDVPIFVSHDSADVWSHPELFWLDARGEPTVVAGVPPDYFSDEGQLWGNPLYRWGVLGERGYDWWIARLCLGFERFDALRLDHFIGFHRAWEVPREARSARSGRYRPGPGEAFFTHVLAALGPVPILAEDLGAVTPEVFALRDRFGFPGMRVLQFAFGSDETSRHHLPENHVPNCVVYTGTHDNDTTVGWLTATGGATRARPEAEIRREREAVLRYLGSDGDEVHWDLIGVALRSVANTAIFPLQDLLGLGSGARMNTPGTARGNWEWRVTEAELAPEVAERMAELTKRAGRLPSGAG